MIDAIRPEYPLIVDFAEDSDLVDLTIDEKFLDLTGDKPLDGALLAYFVAGAVKFDLEHPSRATERNADIGDAIREALVYYRVHRRAHPDRLNPLFERFDALDREGKLDEYIQRQVPAAPQ